MRFITDMGAPITLTDTTTGETTVIGQYGVWDDAGRPRGADVIACGHDLDALQTEYGPDLPVHLLTAGKVIPA